MTKEDVIKLVIPPNLLKQENVCLIPREAEHPSKIVTVVFTHSFRDLCDVRYIVIIMCKAAF